MMRLKEKQKNPLPTVDVIIHSDEGVLLIKRKNPPPGWAIPGGFIDAGETAEEAAVREMKEETGLHVILTDLLGVYSAPKRDPRLYTVSIVFTGEGRGHLLAGDDAKEARFFREESLPGEIAFDHRKILSDYFRYIKTGIKPNPIKF